jgi:hypothetical protein
LPPLIAFPSNTGNQLTDEEVEEALQKLHPSRK